MPPGEPTVALILARADNGVIGAHNDLPWHLPRDLKRFKALTLGKPIIMGRRTHESIGRPLPGRDNIVITRQHGFTAPGCMVVSSLDAAFDAARDAARASGADEICVIGGGEIYRAALDRAKRVYLTEVHMEASGDVTLPPFDADVWQETAREEVAAAPGEPGSVSFVVLERRKRR